MTRSQRVAWCAIGLGAGVRLAVAATLGLGVDETYEVVVGRQVSAGYYDHPPLSFWLAHAAARIGGERDIVVRLPFILLYAATTWLMYRLTARCFGERAGAVAAILLNVAAVFAVSTGGWVLPDGPLAFGCVAAAYCLVRAMLDPREPHPAAWWAGAGVSGGIALLSKYHAILFLAGALAFLVTRPVGRRWLRRPEPYLAAAIAVALFVPDLAWNARHDWASLAFQLGRGVPAAHVSVWQRVAALGQNVAAQAAWVLPWIWIPLVVVLARTIATRPIDDRSWLFVCLGSPMILVFTAAAVGGRPGLPHWPAPGWLMIVPLLAAAAAARLDRGDVVVRWWLAGSTLAFAMLIGAAGIAIASGWQHARVTAQGRRGDPTLDMLDWRDLPRGLDSLGLRPSAGWFIAAPSWIQAAKAGYALGPSVPVLALTPDPHHFGFLDAVGAARGHDVVIVTRLPARHDVPSTLGPAFASLELVGRVPIRRRGTTEFELAVYLARGFRGAGYLRDDRNPVRDGS